MIRHDLARLESLKMEHQFATQAVQRQVAATFTYAGLDLDVAAKVRGAAERVRAKEREARKSLIEIGRELLAVKEMIPHGAFGPWLEVEFQWDERTAQNYMNVARTFGSKTEIVSLLPDTAVQKLSAPSTPAEVRADVIARVEAGEKFTAKKVALIVKASSAGKQLAEAEAGLSPRDRKKLENEKAQFAADVKAAEQAHLARTERVREAAALILEKLGGDCRLLEPYIDVLPHIGRYLADGVNAALAGSAQIGAALDTTLAGPALDRFAPSPGESATRHDALLPPLIVGDDIAAAVIPAVGSASITTASPATEAA